MVAARYTDASLCLMAQQEAQLLGDALNNLKAAIRPLLDDAPYSEHVEIRKAFNDAAVKAGRALDLKRERLIHS